MRTPFIAAHLLILTLALTAVGCSTPGSGARKAATAARPPENADLWRQVKNDPPAWVPRAWPKSMPAAPPLGKWIVDARDATSYFVPNTTCGGLTPGVWEGEALKITHRYTEGEEFRRKASALLIGVPAKAVLGTLIGVPTGLAMMVGSAGGGMGGGISAGSVSPNICGIGGIGGSGAGCSGGGAR